MFLVIKCAREWGGGEMSLNSYCGLIDCWHSIGRVLSASNNDEPHMKI